MSSRKTSCAYQTVDLLPLVAHRLTLTTDVVLLFVADLLAFLHFGIHRPAYIDLQSVIPRHICRMLTSAFPQKVYCALPGV